MKRIIPLLTLLMITFISAAAQQAKAPATVTDDEWQSVLVAVSNEDWVRAVDLSAKFLKQMKEDDERLLRLRYIYLYAAAGKVSAGGMTFEEIGELAKKFVGKEVVLPFRPITLDCRDAFNFVCPSEGSKNRLMVAASNKAATTILAFEYVQLKEPFDFARHEGEPVSISGTFEDIQPNPNKSRGLLILRIFISDGVMKLKEKAPAKQISTDG